MRSRLRAILAAALLMGASGCCIQRECVFVDLEDVYDWFNCGKCGTCCHCPYSCPPCPYYDYDKCEWYMQLWSDKVKSADLSDVTPHAAVP